jgi:hypothetical protein
MHPEIKTKKALLLKLCEFIPRLKTRYEEEKGGAGQKPGSKKQNRKNKRKNKN